MRQIVNISNLSNWLRLAFLCIFILFLHGCAVMKTAKEESFFSPSHPEEELVRNQFSVTGGDDVIGQLAVIRLEKGDTLPDIARHFSWGSMQSVQLTQELTCGA